MKWYPMMNKYVPALLICLAFFLASCKEKNKVFSLMEMEAVPVQGEIVAPDLMAPCSRQMVFLQSRLCLVMPELNEVCLVIDPDNGKEVGYFGSVGEGPGEMGTFPCFVEASVAEDTVCLYNQEKNSLMTYRLDISDDTVKYHFIDKKELAPRTPDPNVRGSTHLVLRRLENGYYVALNMLSKEHLFSLYDKELNYVKDFGGYPLEGLVDDNLDLLSVFDGTLQVYRNRVYYAALKFGYMACYEVEDDGTVVPVWNHTYATVDYKIDNKQIRFKGKNNRHGFSDLALDEDYIFATYSGIPSGEMYRQRSVYAVEAQSLVILSRKTGEALRKYRLQSRVNLLCLSEDGKYLYVEHIDPEVQIERFPVKDLLP